MEKRLTSNELAEVLGITRRTLDNELKSPDCNIPYNRIGKRKFFFLSEVLLATKITPVDKKEIVESLNLLIKLKCAHDGDNNCLHEQIKDVIKFITKSDKDK